MSDAEKISTALIENPEFITDCARYADGVLTETQVKKKYRFDDNTWTRLGEDDKLIEAIEAENTRRIRRGDTARERAQTHFAAAPDILNQIMNDSSASARNRIESAKELRVCADHRPEIAPAAAAERFVISINLGAGEILTFDKAITPRPHDDIDNVSQELLLANKRENDSNSTEHNAVDAKDDQLPTPWGLITANKQTDDGGGEPL